MILDADECANVVGLAVAEATPRALAPSIAASLAGKWAGSGRGGGRGSLGPQSGRILGPGCCWCQWTVHTLRWGYPVTLAPGLVGTG